MDPGLVAVFDRVLADLLDLRGRYADGPGHDMDSHRALMTVCVAGGGE